MLDPLQFVTRGLRFDTELGIQILQRFDLLLERIFLRTGPLEFGLGGLGLGQRLLVFFLSHTSGHRYCADQHQSGYPHLPHGLLPCSVGHDGTPLHLILCMPTLWLCQYIWLYTAIHEYGGMANLSAAPE